MIIIENCKQFKQGALAFDVCWMDADTTTAVMRVKSAKLVNGQLYGPAFKLPNGSWVTTAYFDGWIKSAIVEALEPHLQQWPSVRRPK